MQFPARIRAFLSTSHSILLRLLENGEAMPTKKLKPSIKVKKVVKQKSPLIRSKENKPARSKQRLILDLLQRSEGATLDEMMKATNWQRHSVRGTLSGVIKRRLQLPVVLTREERGFVYRIVSLGANA